MRGLHWSARSSIVYLFIYSSNGYSCLMAGRRLSDSATPVSPGSDILRARIEAGTAAGRPVPSETTAADRCPTARKAIALLRDQGLVVTVKGRGSYVNPGR